MTLAHALSRSGTAPATCPATRMLINMSANGNLKFPLDREILTIGRHDASDICLCSRYISRSHARIINLATGAVIEDLDSHNGVYVNTRRVRYRELHSGDLIQLGTLQLRYIDLYEQTTDEGHA